MSQLLTAFDLLLIATLVGIALAALTSREPRRAVILFIAFGLLLALVWARLRAPDLALAEAAIGAGLGGALMLAAGRRAAARRAARSADSSTNGEAAAPAEPSEPSP